MTAESVPGRLGVERRRPRRPQRVRGRNGAAQVDHRHQRRPLRLRRRRDEGNVLLLKIMSGLRRNGLAYSFFRHFLSPGTSGRNRTLVQGILKGEVSLYHY
jgi:hypothetical protein